MKKEEILFIRAMSVVAALAVMTLILIFGLKNSLFIGIADDINSNTVDLTQAGASIYNLYFYKGLNTIYIPMFSIALFAVVSGAVGVLTKYRGAGMLAGAGAIAMTAVGAYMVFAYIAEGSSVMHRLIDGFYLDDVSGSIETARLMGKAPLICGILLIILGAITLLLVKSSRINRIEVYAAKSSARTYGSLIVIAYAAVYLEWIRPIIVNMVCKKEELVLLANSFITDYFFDGKWFLNLSYVWFAIITAVLILVLRKQYKSFDTTGKDGRKKLLYLAVGIPVVVIAVRSIIYAFNRPRLFGYLTVDETVCDMVEASYVPYMLMYITDVLFLTMMITLLMFEAVSTKKMLSSLIVDTLISVVIIVLSGFLTGVADGRFVMTLMYTGSALANLAGLVSITLGGKGSGGKANDLSK